MHDVFGNSVAQVEFEQAAPSCDREHAPYRALRAGAAGVPDRARGQMYPFVYSANDRGDLGRLLDRHYPDPRGSWSNGPSAS